MNAVVQRLERTDKIIQEMGTVVDRDGATWKVTAPSGDYEAKRAVSCLVAPAIGAEVLLVRGEGRAYVLAVLEGTGDKKAMRLEVDGDVTMHVSEGSFAVAASEGVDLVAGDEITTTSRSLRMRASEGHLFIDSLSYLGSRVLVEVSHAKTVMSVLDSVADRISQRVKRVYRTVEELDQLRAEQVDYKAEQNIRVRGKNALVTAEELVKVDGEQIHIG